VSSCLRVKLFRFFCFLCFFCLVLRARFRVLSSYRADRELDLEFYGADVLTHDPRLLLWLQTTRGSHFDGAAGLAQSIESAPGQFQFELTRQATYGAVQVFVRRFGGDGVLLDKRVQPPNVVREAFELYHALLRDGTEFSGHVRKIAESGILATHPSAKEAVVSRIIAYAPAVVWAALLLFLGGRSDVPTVETPLPLDKAAHFLLYGLLGVLATFGWRRARFWPHLALPIACAIAVGAIDELNQRSVNGRSSDVADWFADTAGILTGCWVVVRKSKEISNAD